MRRRWVTVVGVVKGSFMTDQPVWAVIGLVLLALAARLLAEALRGNRS